MRTLIPATLRDCLARCNTNRSNRFSSGPVNYGTVEYAGSSGTTGLWAMGTQQCLHPLDEQDNTPREVIIPARYASREAVITDKILIRCRTLVSENGGSRVFLPPPPLGQMIAGRQGGSGTVDIPAWSLVDWSVQ